MPDTPLAFVLPPRLTAVGLKSRLGAHLTLQDQPAHPIERVYYDTFDWRLYNAGLVLEQDCSGDSADWRLYELATGEEVAQLGPVAAGNTPCPNPRPFFVAVLPESSLRETLEPLTWIRALLPLAHLTGTTSMLRVLNKDLKTVARVAVEDTGLTGAGARLPAVARLLPVRGYDRQLAEVSELLAAMPGLEPTAEDPMLLAVRAAGHTPGDYASRLNIPLDPTERADSAARAIHRNLFDTMERNESGVRADTDSEFLHDYRVAVRRTRSALSQIKDVFPERKLDHFKTEFGWLGQITGPTRDLDVYLLQFEDLRAAVPAHMQDDLEALRQRLIRKQKEEHDKLVAALESARYAKLRRDWAAFLNQSPPKRPAAANALRPVAEVANEEIRRMHRRAVREARAITPETPAEQVHELRKTCKKLRYLMEFYGALYPPEELKALVTELKQLQDVLGEYQDLQVQIAALDQHARDMQVAGAAPAPTLLAMGALTGTLYNREMQARADLMPRLERFTRPKLRRRFADLFNAPPDAPDGDPTEDGEPAAEARSA